MTTKFFLDARYYKWLYRQIGNPREKNPAHSYKILTGILYDMLFKWSIPNDENRAEDARDLRYVYCCEKDLDDSDIYDEPITVLEALIGIAKRLDFLMDGTVEYWFRTLLKNIDLDKCNDDWFIDEQGSSLEVMGRIEAVMAREYSYSGEGGLFPLKHPKKDQRKVEIWYQMQAYLNEVYS